MSGDDRQSPKRASKAAAGGRVARGRFEGSPAERLTRLWRAEDFERFDPLLDEILDEGRQAVLDVAIGKLSEEERSAFIEDVDDLAETVRMRDAEGVETGSSLYWFLCEVRGPLDEPPPAAAIEAAFETRLREGSERLEILPLWLDPDPLSFIGPCDRRALLRHMIESEENAVVFVGEQELGAEAAPRGEGAGESGAEGEGEEDEEGFLVAVVGRLDAAVAAVEDQDDWDEERAAAEGERMIEAMEAFSRDLVQADSRIRRCLPVGALRDLLDQIAFDEEEDEEGETESEVLEGLDESVEVAVAETADGVVDARLRWRSGRLEVALATGDGAWLDTVTVEIGEDRLAAAVDVLKRRCRDVLPAGDDEASE